MKTLPTRSILLVAGLGVWTLVSTAQAHPSRGHRFDRFDTDGDGRLTRAEVDKVTRKRVDALFERMDADDSGQVTADELEAVRKERKTQEDDRSKRRRRWRRRRAREAEVSFDLELHFDRLDADESGGIDRKDLESARLARLNRAFERFDRDHDGAITRSEIHQAIRERL